MASRTYNWIGTLGGDWATALDWSSDAVPNTGSISATITTPGSYAVSIASSEKYSINALTLAVGPTLEIAGGLTLGGTLAGRGTVDISKGGTLALTGTVAAAFNNDGLISDTSGLLVLGGALAGSGAIEIASGGTVDVLGATAERVVFGGPNGILTLATPSGFQGTISGFEQTDTIDLVGVIANSVALSGNIITLLENGATVDTLTLASHYQGASFSLATSGATTMVFESGINYAVEGPVWASPTITWSFATSNFASDAAIGTFTNQITQSADEAVVEQALSDWAAVTGLTFEQVADSATTDIRIGWGSFSGSEIGETDYGYSGKYFSADTLVRLEDPALDSLSLVGGTLMYSGSETSLLQLALHEIGHALGLAHTSDSHAIMYPVSTQNNRVLDASDIAGIQALYAGDLACFAAGTAIATPSGEVPVERLQAGDWVLTDAAAARRIIWTGHRSVDCARQRNPSDVWPVCVRAHAFGPGQPHMDLFLSPDHAVFSDAWLIPVKHLIDGDSVTQVPTRQVTYWHVELETHDVLRAAGLPVESYLDTDNRHQFHKAGPSRRLTWADACWPLCVTGPPVARLRRRLALRRRLIAADGYDLPAASAEPPHFRYLLPKQTREINLIRPERVRGLLIDGRLTEVRPRVPASGVRVVELLAA
jgi:hypothetical protein